MCRLAVGCEYECVLHTHSSARKCEAYLYLQSFSFIILTEYALSMLIIKKKLYMHLIVSKCIFMLYLKEVLLLSTQTRFIPADIRTLVIHQSDLQVFHAFNKRLSIEAVRRGSLSLFMLRFTLRNKAFSVVCQLSVFLMFLESSEFLLYIYISS